MGPGPAGFVPDVVQRQQICSQQWSSWLQPARSSGGMMQMLKRECQICDMPLGLKGKFISNFLYPDEVIGSPLKRLISRNDSKKKISQS